MNGERRARTIHRILVALDASPHSLAALRAAAELAAALQAELLALYVEDISLLRLAELPFAREYGAFTANARQVNVEQLERQLRARSGQARQAVTAVAERAQVRWSFRVTRGTVSAEVLSAASEVDLITVGRTGWSPIGTRRLGSTARAVLAQAPGLAMILEQGIRLGLPVLVLFDGTPSAQRALNVAIELAQARGGHLILLIPSDDRATAGAIQEEVSAWMAEQGLSARYRLLVGAATVDVARTVQVEGCGLLVMAGDTPWLTEDGLLQHLSVMSCPVLLVK